MPRVVRGPLLNPRPDRTIDYIADAALAADERGRVGFVGPWQVFASANPGAKFQSAGGLIFPPMLDLHTHAPQHPIRGHFLDGIDDPSSRGRLLSGLLRNVFPAEERFEKLSHARAVVDAFAADTLRQGVVGGSVFLTVHAEAAFDSLTRLDPLWRGGLVLMDQNCPPTLRNDRYVQPDLRNLAQSLGERLLITDRFAIANSSASRRYGASIAREFGLMTQTHLNEQLPEKQIVEKDLYRDAESYTHVYLRDGLLDTRSILAHCIHMRDDEWSILQSRRAAVAHCPTSNALLGSGVMHLDELIDRGIDYAICTDVGASPSTSLLAEMAMFLLVHRGRSRHATACEALWRTTRGPAEVFANADHSGSLDIGGPMSYVVAECGELSQTTSAEDVIRKNLLRLETFSPRSTHAHVEDLASGLPNEATIAAFTEDAATLKSRLEGQIRRVVLAGKTRYRASPSKPPAA